MIMKKLEVGDYVKNLTEEQWESITNVANSPLNCITYDTSFVGNDSMFFENSLMASKKCVLYAEKIYCKTELTFEEFLLRAKNTFQS